MLVNINAALVGTYWAVRDQHAGRYLAEFEYRFNHRYDLGEMIPRLAAVAVTTAPMPYRLLTLADVQAQSGRTNLVRGHSQLIDSDLAKDLTK